VVNKKSVSYPHRKLFVELLERKYRNQRRGLQSVEYLTLQQEEGARHQLRCARGCACGGRLPSGRTAAGAEDHAIDPMQFVEAAIWFLRCNGSARGRSSCCLQTVGRSCETSAGVINGENSPQQVGWMVLLSAEMSRLQPLALKQVGLHPCCRKTCVHTA